MRYRSKVVKDESINVFNGVTYFTLDDIPEKILPRTCTVYYGSPGPGLPQAWIYQDGPFAGLDTNTASSQALTYCRTVLADYILSSFLDGTLTSPAHAGVTSYQISEISDTSTPNFHKLRGLGKIVNNAMRARKISITSLPVSAKTEVTYNPQNSKPLYTREGRVARLTQVGKFRVTGTGYYLTTSDVMNIIDQVSPRSPHSQTAINQAYANVQAGEVELLTMLAEGRKTMASIVSVFARIAKLVIAIKTGNFAQLAPKTYKKWKHGDLTEKSKVTAAIASDAWMEARYAWRPLIYDLRGMMNILSDKVSKRSTFRASDRSSLDDSIDITVPSTSSGRAGRFKGRLTGTATTRAGVLCSTQFNMSSAQVTGAFNVATMVKEVIPFSFVLEWFVNLGGLLYTLNPNPIFKAISAWATTRTEIVLSGQMEFVDGKEIVSVPVFCTLSLTQRDPNDGPSILPTLDVNLTPSRIIDGIILLLRAK